MRSPAIATLLAAALFTAHAPAQTTVAPAAAVAPAASPPTIQIAILLDTSGSMDGLIAQAKTQIWSIVNQMTRAKMEGVRPALKVALYEYGKSTIAASENHLRQILPLTDDLDEVSAQLFKLTTDGGEEYCGAAIKAAAEGLSWSSSPRDLRIIVIAGNEPFSQGGVDYRDAVGTAVKRGLIVNTIFCGGEAEGAGSGWKDGALLGEGTYGFIDQSAASVHIPAPQDTELTALSAKLNTTYLAYGRRGQEMAERQEMQDTLTTGAAAGPARAASKASHLYKNSAWDLVDAVKEKQVKLEEIKDEDLPETMRGKSAAERETILAVAAKERSDIQARIQALSAERDKFIAAQQQAAGDKTLGSALLAALQKQAEGRGYAFEGP